MVHHDELLFLGTRGRVRAVEKRSGETVWETALPRTFFDIVALLHEDGVLYAGCHGRLFALDVRTGDILWRNDLEGLGYGAVLLATTRQPGAASVPAAVAAQQAADAQAAAAAS